VFIQITEKTLEYIGFDEIVAVIEIIRKKTNQKFLVHLDHGKDIDIIKKAMLSGFDSVMFDGSQIGLDKNILISREIRKIARRKNILFEGEVGKIGSDDIKLRRDLPFKTNPPDAVQYCEQVKPDMAAVAFGNIHGSVNSKEILDFSLLAKISGLIKTPLVIHGCSNRNDREYKTMISIGAVKINIDTELREAFAREAKRVIARHIVDPRIIIGQGCEMISRKVRDKIKLFSLYS